MRKKIIHNFLSYSGLALITLGFGSSFFVFIFGLPEFRYGIWPQSEPTVTAFHLSSFIIALGFLLLKLSAHRALAFKAITHPYAALPFGIFLYSLLTLPFQNLPIRHLLGSPHLGEGLAFWAGWGLMIAAALLLRRLKILNMLIVAAALIGFATTLYMLLDFRWRGNLQTPLYFFGFFLHFPSLAWVRSFCGWRAVHKNESARLTKFSYGWPYLR
jgi:hypothetical protein